MTTYDPKYKHKPSEKHTLEEVLQSLQDLIRNDLPETKSAGSSTGAAHADRGAAKTEPRGQDEQRTGRERSAPVREDFAPSNPASGPVNFDAVMRSLRDLINNELDVGDQPASAAASASPAAEQQGMEENSREEHEALDEEPIFEDTDETVSSGEQSASFSAPPEMGEGISGESEALDEELTFEDSDAQNISDEFAPLEEPAPPPNAGVAGENPAEEFAPLDEELTFEASIESVPSPPVDSIAPELPGEISPELLNEPEVVRPTAEPDPAKQEITAQGAQQEFFLEEPPTPAVEHAPLLLNLPPEEEALPTIDVEETFDASGYFEAEALQEESQPSEKQEIQNIIASALVSPAETDTAPPAKSERKLEIVEDPLPENLSAAVPVDFDTIDFPPPDKGPQASSVTDAAAPGSEPPPTPAETSATTETTDKVLRVTEERPAAEAKVESIREPEQTLAPSENPPAPIHEHMEVAPYPAEEFPAPLSSDLDDIPVLKEVVAPPAGSALIPDEIIPPAKPRLPAPNRARDIVVRAVAKLNVEMRKSGGAGLDTKTILRLQKLIRQELEKDSEK